MLRELFVQNLALIEDVRVELRPGFCAWTGQTGAGKTLLLEALGLLLGERGSAELLRAGADELRITGRFELTRPELRARGAGQRRPAAGRVGRADAGARAPGPRPVAHGVRRQRLRPPLRRGGLRRRAARQAPARGARLGGARRGPDRRGQPAGGTG